MEKYIISNIQFDSKTEIKQKIQEIEKKYLDYQPVSGDDLNFMLDVFSHHYNFKKKTSGMTDIYFAPHKEYKTTRCAHIAYGNKNIDIKSRPSDDISWTMCVKRIRKKKLKINGHILTFGKYKGKTVEEVCQEDRQYLEWILREFKDTGVKTEVKKHIKPNNKMETIQTTMKLEYKTDKKQKTSEKPIAQYDTGGNLIRIYNSGKETEENGYNSQCVSKCVHNKMKLHKNFIFIKISNNQNADPKIDPTPYLINLRNSVKSEKVENIKNSITIQATGLRIGMFNKQKELLEVFTNNEQIVKKFGHNSGVYDHLYGKILTKNKRKKGYKNLYFFRKLNIGQTYNIGEKYDLNQFENATPRKFTNSINPKPTNNTVPVKETEIIPVYNQIIPVEELKNILPEEPKKRNFMQRLKYLFTGK
jgi:hypothetical protein